jgi:hypothetical protein
MAHLWILDNDQAWVTQLLAGDAVSLAELVTLQRTPDASTPWALLSGDPRLRLNGMPVPAGLAMLEDRDEIRLPGRSMWFSTELRAQVQAFPASATRGYCPRCKQAIDAGTAAVCCPQCALWHHASEELPCWTYASTCAACSQDTSLEAGFRWTPEDL